MIRLLTRSLAFLLLVNAACMASFAFSLTPTAYNSGIGDATIRVSVTNSGAAASGISKIDAPIKFTMGGGMSSAQLTSMVTVTPAFTSFPSQNDLPVPLPYAVSKNQVVDFSGIYAPGISLGAGATIGLWVIGVKLTQAGSLAVGLNVAGQFAANSLGFDSLGNGLIVSGSVDGTILPISAAGTVSYVSAVPEPSSFLFMGLVGVWVGGVRWFEKKGVA